MEYSIKSGSPEKQRCSCIVIPIFKGRRLSKPAQVLDDVTDGAIKQFLKRGDIEGNIDEIAWIYDLENTLSDRVLFIGCGNERDIDPAVFKKICARMITALNTSGATDAVSYLGCIDTRIIDKHWMVRQTVLTTEETLYRFDQFKTTQEKPRRPLRKLTLCASRRKELSHAEQVMREGIAIAEGMRFAKDLANSPPNICNPEFLAQQALQLKKTYTKLEVDILDEADMEALGMGSFLSVTRGTKQPAKLIALHYNGTDDGNQKPVVLVGKGITFDSGGISLKPGLKMDEMKYDMGGAASVFGTLVACMHIQAPVHVVGLIAAAENMPSGSASRPGDIVTSMSGQTIEILNTDAEGRLVLCDTLTYAKKYDPEVVIDIATLTGACIVALGHHASAMLSNSPGLARELTQVANAIDDRIWELPLWDVYGEQLKSNFADMANIGGPAAGTITAASFLSRFTGDYRWAHLDIAGTAWVSGENKGATGRPVPLLTEFLLERTRES